MTNTVEQEVLEERAADQRRQIHNSISDLRGSIEDKVSELKTTVQEKLDVKKNARQYMMPIAGLAAMMGMMLGYGLTGIFVRD